MTYAWISAIFWRHFDPRRQAVLHKHGKSKKLAQFAILWM